MTAYIKSLSGATVTVAYTPTTRVRDVKAYAAKQLMWDSDVPIKLILAGNVLDDERLFGDFKPAMHACFHIVQRPVMHESCDPNAACRNAVQAESICDDSQHDSQHDGK